MQPETRFKIKVLPLLKKIPNSWVYKCSDVTKSGIPDVLMCVNGYFIAVELKTETGKTSKLQDINIEKITDKAKGIAVVMTPLNYKVVIDYIKRSTQ